MLKGMAITTPSVLDAPLGVPTFDGRTAVRPYSVFLCATSVSSVFNPYSPPTCVISTSSVSTSTSAKYSS